MQIKKILGILLAFCFVMSVTAATAAANDNNNWSKDKKDDKNWNHKNWNHEQKFKIVYKMVKVPGHWDKKVVKKVVYKNHQKIVIKKVVKVWVPAKWITVPVKVPVNNHHGHR